MPTTHVVVVGAGLAGLRVGSALRRRGYRVTVVERAQRAGGRVRSVYDAKSRDLEYEAGPWRVPSKHARVRRLCSELGVALEPLRAPPPPLTTPPPAANGLSIWGSYALQARDPLVADAYDIDTGYADQTRAASGTNPYINDSDEFYIAPAGFARIVDGLASQVDCIEYETRVVNVRRTNGRYHVEARRRRGDERYESVNYKADVLVVCVPPTACKAWDVMRAHAMPVLSAVAPTCLNHIYVREPTLRNVSFHTRDARSLLAQSIGDAYGSGWFQLSYSGGRVARLWYNLFLSQPVRYMQVLASEMWARLGGHRPLQRANVRMHFWEHAVHYWVPAPGFDLARAVELARQPHPFKLPDLYLAGEAYSAEQAWMEGALSTADAVVRDVLARRRPPTRAVDRTRELALDGRILDVEAWADVHPGGRTAIEAHLKDPDVDELFRHIHTTESAWAFAFSMQRGWSE